MTAWQDSVVAVLPAGSDPLTTRTKGTGFLASASVVVTCAHVVRVCLPEGGLSLPASVQVVFDATGDTREAIIDRHGWWPAVDIAILRLTTAPPAGIDGLPLGSSLSAEGHPFRTIGYPHGARKGEPATGNVTAVVTSKGRPTDVQLSSNMVTAGYSGAPVWDEQLHRVVGMVYRIIVPDDFRRGDWTGYAKPAEMIVAACPALAISDECPYRGLEPFAVADARYFFGRDDVVNRIVDRLEQKPSVIAVFGPSGSGKSSLIQAGVIARLKNMQRGDDEPEGDRPIDTWFFPEAVRRYDRITSVLTTLEDARPDQHTLLVLDQFEAVLAVEDSTERQGLLARLAELVERPATTIVIVMRSHFYSRFMRETPESLRAPALDNLFEIPATLTRDDIMNIIVGPASEVRLHLRHGLAERIAGDVLSAAAEQGDGNHGAVLPLLEFALTELWHRREPPYLTHAGYDQIKGVVGGLPALANAALDALGSDREQLARKAMVALVRVVAGGTGVQYLRQWLTRDELANARGATGIHDVITVLEDKRLLRPGGGRDGEPERVQLVHDALIHRWDKLRGWLNENWAFMVWEGNMLTRAREWEAGTGALLRDYELAEAERKLEERSGELQHPIPEWIATSIAADRAARKRLERLVRGVTVAALLLLGVSIVAVWFYLRAEDQSRLNRVQSIASQSRISQSTGDDEQAALLALEAWRLDGDREFSGPVGTALQGSIGAPSFSTLSADHPSEVQHIAYSGDGRTMAVIRDNGGLEVFTPSGQASCEAPPGADGSARSVRANRAALDDDGSLLALGSRDSFVHLWRIDGGSCDFEQSLPGPGGQVAAIAIATDADTLTIAMGSCRTENLEPTAPFSDLAEKCAAGGARVRVWHLRDTPTLAADRPIDGRFACALAIDPERGWLAASGCGDVSTNTSVCAPEAGAIALWPLDGVAEAPLCLTGHRGDVRALAFDRCTGMLASGGTDRAIRLWDVEAQTATRTLIGHAEPVRGLSFSRDCAFLGSASEDGGVGLWYLAEANPVIDVVGSSTQWVRTVAFGGADGLDLSAEAPGGKVRTWHLGDRAPVPGNLYGHERYVRALAFSPQPGALLLASSAEDGTLRLWDLKRPWLPPILPGFGDRPPGAEIVTVAFSHDGRFIAAADNGGRIWVWDVATPERPLDSLRIEARAEVTLTFHPREDQLVAGTRRGELILWALQGPGAPSLVRIGEKVTVEPDVAITALAFRPDGVALAAGDQNGTITIRAWRPDGLAESPWYALDGGERIHALAYSPDGSRLASGGNDAVVRIWNTRARYRLMHELVGHENEVRSLAYSPDGGTLASGSVDQTIRLWSTKHLDRSPVIVFGISEWVRALAISPDGEVLASAATEGRIRLLVPNSDTLAAQVCDHVTRNLSEAEWVELVGSDSAYQPTCSGIEPGEPAPTSAAV